jgi:hypothetical protein
MGGDRRSRLPEHRTRVVELVAAQPDLTLQEIRSALAGHGISIGLTSLWRFLRAQNITLKKKSLHAAEQDRPDVAEKRRAFIRRQPSLDPDHLVFIDETPACAGAGLCGALVVKVPALSMSSAGRR